MYNSFAAPTPLTGPHPLSRPRAVLGALRRGAGHARVVVLPDGVCWVLRRGERLRLGAALAGRYRAVYHVDEDGHTADVTCELPSRGGPPFEARVRLLWWVHDVQAAVQARVGDVRDALQPLLEAFLGRVTREHPVAEIGAAEDRVRRELAGDLPLDLGLTIRTYAVTLAVDRAAATPGAAQGDAAADDPLERVRRDILVEQERGRLALLRARNDVAAWQVRLAFYRNVVESGLPALLALRLMVDPAAATEVASYAVGSAGEGSRPWPARPAWPDPDAVEGGPGDGRAGGSDQLGDGLGDALGASLEDRLAERLGGVVYLPDEADRDG